MSGQRRGVYLSNPFWWAGVNLLIVGLTSFLFSHWYG